MAKWGAIAGLMLVLLLVNLSIWQKEQLLQNGQVIYLQLAPVDPRSLMQGDYMALDFAIAQEVQRAAVIESNNLSNQQGYVVASVDDRGVASFKALDNGQQLANNDVRLSYRIQHGRVKFATDAFFFQEGQGEQYAAARYGGFRVNQQGEMLLTTMHDDTLNRLGNDKNSSR